jgi:hypothetical protein
VASAGKGLGWGSVLVGLASVATLPLAIFLTRFSERYELLHAGFAIPVGGALGIAALALARRARRRSRLSLSAERGDGLASAGRVLGILGLCLALAAVVSLVVYALLDYVGEREWGRGLPRPGPGPPQTGLI